MVINRWQRAFVVSVAIGVALLVVRVVVTQAAPALTEPTQSPISLSGQWQFYWGQLLSPADFADGATANGASIAVPSSWAGQVLGPNVNAGQPLPYFGVATYCAQVVIPPDQVRTHTMLLLESVGSAYQIWVNGELLGGLGTVAHDPARNETPRFM
ncbi:MAG: hypothetical protein DWI30_08310 [Chloroflexi bacterium]|nr:MAG: hypothetical protein DWI30_08310 [Chloroflexota bacterium]